MATPYIGEIKIFSFDYAPRGWAVCSGQIMQIAQNQALFSILGTFYGGDGRVTFALPDLRGRVPIHYGSPNYGGVVNIGFRGGEETHILTNQEMPSHTHSVTGSNGAPNANTPLGNFWAQAPGGYATKANGLMSPNAAIGLTGGNQGHENRSPYLALNICIALTGDFPPRN